MDTAESFLEVAETAARRAGEYLLENFGKIQPEQVDEKSRHDFVTHVDKTAEKMIIDHIRAHYPEHSILAEESGWNSQTNAFGWVIDPLDGTKNFIQRLPYFCVSIAVRHHHQVVMGLVYDPIHNELFKALRGKGAFLNDHPIRISSQRQLNRMIFATGFPHRSKTYLPMYLQAFEEIFLQVTGVRRMGAAALDLCYTAAGRFAGFWELGLMPWDIAAASLIVEEAGGVITDFWGRPHHLESGFIIAGNQTAHQFLKTVLSVHFPEKKENRPTGGILK